jgi:hypothetical protein
MYVVIWPKNKSWRCPSSYACYGERPPWVFETYEETQAEVDEKYGDMIVTYDEAMMIAATEELCT